MSRPLTDGEREKFRDYAIDNLTDPDGSLCQWADQTLRLLDEVDELRQERDIWKRHSQKLDQILREALEMNPEEARRG